MDTTETTAAKPRTVDITPTWSAVLPILLGAFKDGTDKGRDAAIDELARLAAIADEHVADARLMTELIDLVRLFAETIRHYIRVDEIKGDYEGANLKSFTLARVEDVLTRVGGAS